MKYRWTILLALAAVGCGIISANAEERILVYLLDPRVVANTKQTFPIQWENKKTDVMGTRTLTAAESGELRALLKEELNPSTDVPFCGHLPAYGLLFVRDGNAVSSITLCGLCETWAKDGKLMFLKGKESLKYLGKIIPLPDAFSGVSIPPDLLVPDRKAPFYDLTLESFQTEDAGPDR